MMLKLVMGNMKLRAISTRANKETASITAKENYTTQKQVKRTKESSKKASLTEKASWSGQTNQGTKDLSKTVNKKESAPIS